MKKPTTRNILLFAAGLMALAALLAVVVGAYAWSRRDEIVSAVARELGVDHVEIATIGFDRQAATITAVLEAVSLKGITAGKIEVAIDLGRLLRDRRIGLSDVILTDLDAGADLLEAAIHAPDAPSDQASSASMAGVWSHLKRFGRVRIENARVGLAPIGVPGAVVVEHAVFTRRDRGRYFEAEAVIRQQIPGRSVTGTLAARCDLFLEGGTLAIRNAHVNLKNFDAPASYFAFFATTLVQAPILPVEELSADAHVLIGPGAETLVVAIERIALKAPMAVATGAFTIDSAKDNTRYDVHVAIERGDQRVLGFLPSELLGQETSRWLAANIKAATVTGGQLDLSGDSHDVEALALRLPAKNTTLTFAPGWPAVEDADANVIIGPNSLHADGVHGRLESLDLKAFQVDIEAFAKPVVKVRAEAASDAQSAFAALARTPLRDAIATIRSQPLTISGPLGATVEVEADVSGAEPQVTVKGSADLLGIRIEPASARIPPLEALRGTVVFSTASIVAANLTGTFDGMPASLKADVHFAGGDVVAHADVRGSYRSQASAASGRALVHAHGDLHAGQSLRYGAVADVDMTGMELAVPGIVQKPAGRARMAKIKLSGTRSGGMIEAVSADLRANVLGLFEAGSWRLGASVADGTRALRPAEPFLGKLDLAAATGLISWPADASRLTAELATLDIPAPPPPATNTGAAAVIGTAPAIDPRDLPPMTLHAGVAHIYGRLLGDVTVQTTKTDEGLILDRVDIDMGPASVYRTTGSWLATPFGTDLKIAGKLRVRDGGRMLSALGFGDDVSGLRGDVAFDADWPDFSFDANTRKLVAHVAVDVEDGRIDNVDNLALKALDLLTLHFLEMREKGLEIEQAKAKLVLHGTDVGIEEARVESSSAQIKMKGSIDLDKETLDTSIALRLKISRTLNAVALGIVNPLLMLGYLTQDADFTVVKLDGLTEHNYVMSGPWSAPKVKLGLFSH